jgi:hypothetical protein
MIASVANRAINGPSRELNWEKTGRSKLSIEGCRVIVENNIYLDEYLMKPDELTI